MVRLGRHRRSGRPCNGPALLSEYRSEDRRATLEDAEGKELASLTDRVKNQIRIILHRKEARRWLKGRPATEAGIREINVMAAIILRIINRLELPHNTPKSHRTRCPMNSVMLFVCR